MFNTINPARSGQSAASTYANGLPTAQRTTLQHDKVEIRFAGKSKTFDQAAFDLAEDSEITIEKINELAKRKGPSILPSPKDGQMNPLHVLTKNNSLTPEILEAFIDLMGNQYLNAKDKTQHTPMHGLMKNLALTPQLLQVALLKRGDLTIKNKFKQTPMHSLSGNRAITAELYEKALKVTTNKVLFEKDKTTEQTPLHLLMANESLTADLLKVALATFSSSDSLCIKDKGLEVPMHRLARNTAVTPEILEMALTAGGNICSVNIYNVTPLHLLMANNVLTPELLHIAISEADKTTLLTEDLDGDTPLEKLITNEALTPEFLKVIEKLKVLKQVTQGYKDKLLEKLLPQGDRYSTFIIALLQNEAKFPYERNKPVGVNTPLPHRLFVYVPIPDPANPKPGNSDPAYPDVLLPEPNPYFDRFGDKKTKQIFEALLAAEIEAHMPTLRPYINAETAIRRESSEIKNIDIETIENELKLDTDSKRELTPSQKQGRYKHKRLLERLKENKESTKANPETDRVLAKSIIEQTGLYQPKANKKSTRAKSETDRDLAKQIDDNDL